MNKLSKEILHDLYVVQNKTDEEIGVQYGVSDVSISKWRRKLGIPTKSQLTRLSADRGQVSELESLTPVQLAELYASMGQRAIANRYGVSKPTIAARLEKFGIQPISKSDRSTSHQDLTEEQKEVCIGTLLGDGHLLERGALKISHYQGQIDYLLHLYRVLSPLTLPISYEEKEMDNGRLTFGFILKTVQHSWLQALRSIFYPEGEKIYPPSVLNSLSPRALAYWYFDDGHLDSGLPSIDIGKLSDAQTKLVVDSVGGRFALDTYERSAVDTSCRILRIRARSADVFFSLIRDYATPDLLYKFPPKHWPKGVFPRLPTKTVDPKLIPKHLSDEAKQWGSLSEDDKAGLVELFTNYWVQAGFPFHIPRPEELEVLLHLESHHVIQDGKIKIRQVGQSICQGICQNIWSAISYGSKSPMELFSDRNTLRELIQFCLKMGGIPNQARLRAALRYWHRNGVYNFRPSAAKALVDRYCRPGGTVLDPCSGYGGRLLGSLLSSARPTYIGCEPATETFIGLQNLCAWVEQYLPDVKGRTVLYQQPAEETIFPDNVDMVLTSPPYWKREIYSSEATQASSRYQSYDTWLQGFWSVVIEKSVKCLRPGGWLILNVDDFQLGGKSYSLVTDTIRIVEGFGLGSPDTLTYLMPGGGEGEPQTESVLCWVKGSKVNYDSPLLENVELPRCRECGKTTPVAELNEEGTCLRCLNATIKTCWCGVKFPSKRKDHEFHNDACYARYRRYLYRQVHPVSGVRTFRCQKCGSAWQTSALGRFTLCPSCQATSEVEGRTKVCEYRHCGDIFVDTSTQNSMKFCCPEHRRREKLFRGGIATDLTYFRDSKETGWRTCQTCHQKFLRGSTETFVRCPTCREEARHKVCGCGNSYVDTSENNTRRYCYICKPIDALNSV